jgi:predicted amidohydrolase YtcJ
LPDVAPEHPVFLARRDGHAAWVNPAARAALNLDRTRAVVAESAFDAARALLPVRSTEERRRALVPRLAELTAAGIAAVDDMVEPWGPEIYAGLRDRGELPLSVAMWLPESIDEADAASIRRAFPAGDGRVSACGIKIFLDGSLAARTAALTRPYSDDPGNSGALRLSARELSARVSFWAGRGWAVAVHAIGDRAVSLALDTLSAAPQPASGAHRIEHAQVVSRSDLSRFERAGILASIQPGHWRDDRPWLAARLGDRPEVVIHPLRSFARSGATVIFGSDWPVSSWDPPAVLAAATDPARGEEALDAATAAAWYTSAPR